MFWNRKKGETIRFEVEGMRCTQCEATIKIALHKIPGVRRIGIHQKKQVTVDIAPDASVSRADLATAIERTGYRVKETTP